MKAHVVLKGLALLEKKTYEFRLSLIKTDFKNTFEVIFSDNYFDISNIYRV